MQLTKAYLDSVLDYDPISGALVWKRRDKDLFDNLTAYKIWNKRFAGKRAGTVRQGCRSVYRRIRLGGRTLKEHRVVWVMMTGEEPPDQIDHIDGDGENNRWNNLRDAEGRNARNRAMNRNNSSGVSGVHWHAWSSKWRACVKVDDKQHYLGIFGTLEEAENAVVSFREQHGFTERHGRLPAKYLS